MFQHILEYMDTDSPLESLRSPKMRKSRKPAAHKAATAEVADLKRRGKLGSSAESLKRHG